MKISKVASMLALWGMNLFAQNVTYFQTGEEFAGPFPSWKSVKDLGVKGDGTTDDAAALSAALGSMKASNNKRLCSQEYMARQYKSCGNSCACRR